MIYVFVAIIIAFVILLAVKSLVKKEFCVLCLSVSLTWLTMLILTLTGYIQDKILLSLFMGSSVLGIYYVVDGRIADKFKVFRLPFYLSMAAAAYFLVSVTLEIKIILLLAGLWFLLLLLYIYRRNPALKIYAKKLVECCKRW